MTNINQQSCLKKKIDPLKGPNGAGKTTAIGIITTEIKPDAGTVRILNEPLNINNIDLFCHNVGLCPQHNPLWEDLTLREHLEFYACLKKLDRDQIPEKCDEFDFFSIRE